MCFCGGLQLQDLNAQNVLVARGLLTFKSQYFKGYHGGDVSTLTKHTAGLPHIIDHLQIFMQYIHSYPTYWMPFLHLSRNNDIVTGTNFSWKIFNI